MCYNAYPSVGTTLELPHYGGQQTRFSRTGGYLHHHTPVKFPLFKEAGLHLLLVVTKTIVLTIHYADAGRHRQQKKGLSLIHILLLSQHLPGALSQ